MLPDGKTRCLQSIMCLLMDIFTWWGRGTIERRWFQLLSTVMTIRQELQGVIRGTQVLIFLVVQHSLPQCCEMWYGLVLQISVLNIHSSDLAVKNNFRRQSVTVFSDTFLVPKQFLGFNAIRCLQVFQPVNSFSILDQLQVENPHFSQQFDYHNKSPLLGEISFTV